MVFKYNKYILSRKDIEENKLMLHEGFCARNNKFCDKCNNVFEISAFEEHIKTHTNFEKKEIALGKNEYKPNLMNSINCSYCLNEFSTDKIKEHESLCDLKLVKCEYCVDAFSQKMLKTHLNKCEAKLLLEKFQNSNYEGNNN